MIRRLACVALVWTFLAAPAAAEQSATTAEEFRSIVEGWTLHFETESGEHFGSEQYLDGDRTIWLPRGGQCTPGVWAEDDGRICFLYDVGISCWRLFSDGADGFSAVAADKEDDPAPTKLRTYRRDHAALLCPEGPGV